MRVLVAGGTGYLGGFVLRELIRRKHWVRALARNPERLAGLFESPTAGEVVRAEITAPESLAGTCEGMDAVFSSVGITRQRDGFTYREVDYQGNLNLLREAQRGEVRHFVYGARPKRSQFERLAVYRAHEDFIAELERSGLNHSIIRSTGLFSHMTAFFRMAQRGRVFLFDDGSRWTNPIHGADLAEVCVDAIEKPTLETSVGGPEVFSYREIAEMALSALERPLRVVGVPRAVVASAVALLGIFSAQSADLVEELSSVLRVDLIEPPHGTRRLPEFFRDLARSLTHVSEAGSTP